MKKPIKIKLIPYRTNTIRMAFYLINAIRNRCRKSMRWLYDRNYKLLNELYKYNDKVKSDKKIRRNAITKLRNMNTITMWMVVNEDLNISIERIHFKSLEEISQGYPVVGTFVVRYPDSVLNDEEEMMDILIDGDVISNLDNGDMTFYFDEVDAYKVAMKILHTNTNTLVRTRAKIRKRYEELMTEI